MQKTSLSRPVTTETLTEIILRGMQDKKGHEIVSLNMQNIDAAEAAFMVICHATSYTHAESITQRIEEVVHDETGEKPWHVEGLENKEWILLDYVDVIVHIFLKEKRSFYNLEELWGDAEIKHHNAEY